MLMIPSPTSRASLLYHSHPHSSTFNHYPSLPPDQPRTRAAARHVVSAPATRRQIYIFPAYLLVESFLGGNVPATSPSLALAEFFELPDSDEVKALDLRIGSGDVPAVGDEVAIHYYGRLAAKQGWRFDSSYDRKDSFGESIPFVFKLGSKKVISGLQAAVSSMKVGGIRRVIIPPSQGYQSTSQEPLPPNFFDRQRLFTTIFNPTRLANGEGSTLGTLIFDIELISLRHQ